MGSEPPSSPATAMSAPLLEATGDSESDSAAAADHHGGGWADDGDAESCCGGEDDGGGSVSVEALSWERWMRECAGYHYQQVVVVGDGKCAAPPATEDVAGGGGGRDAESDRLFWEACIAHGF